MTWHAMTPFFRLKIQRNVDFAEQLLNPKKELSPQEKQGMWQAYGQMRAARTLARGTVLATGILGTTIWLQQQSLKKQEKTLEKNKIETIKFLQELMKLKQEAEQKNQKVAQAQQNARTQIEQLTYYQTELKKQIDKFTTLKEDFRNEYTEKKQALQNIEEKLKVATEELRVIEEKKMSLLGAGKDDSFLKKTPRPC